MIHTPSELPLRLAGEGELGGRTFQDYLLDRTRDDRKLAERLTVFLHQWDIDSDERGRGPTPPEYAERWRMPVASAYRQYQEFRSVFPTEATPERLLRLLWDGVNGPRPRHLFSVLVIPEFEEHRP
jgi:hypothetical protein